MIKHGAGFALPALCVKGQGGREIGQGFLEGKDVGRDDLIKNHQLPRWWFQIFLIFTSMWGRFPF